MKILAYLGLIAIFSKEANCFFQSSYYPNNNVKTNNVLRSSSPTLQSTPAKVQALAAPANDYDDLPPPQLSFGFLKPLKNLITNPK